MQRAAPNRTETSKARLRTRTGCSICRRRRVKCGEQRPACHNCVAGGRQCVWPGPDDVDNRARPRVRASSQAGGEGQTSSLGPWSLNSSPPAMASPRTTSSALALIPSCPDLASTSTFPPAEMGLVHHYLNVFNKLLLLPTADPGDSATLTTEIVGMMMRSDGVKSAVLASAAANMFALSGDQRHENIALGYYDKTVKYVSGALGHLGRLGQNQPSKDLTTAVTYLYVYDLWGQDSSLDARKHVTGAINLLKLRYNHGSPGSPVVPPWERVLTESVIYQAFFLAIRKPLSPDFDLDSDFFQANGFNHIASLCSDTTHASPVLGLPLQLYFLVVSVVRAQTLHGEQRRNRLRELRPEVALWEQRVETASNESVCDFATDAVALFVLATSLLLNRNSTQELTSHPTENGSTSQGHACMKWQVQRMLHVFQRPEACDLWNRCYLGAWPMLVMGYSVHHDAHISLVRAILAQMMLRTGYGEFRRISEELELLWAQRAAFSGGCTLAGALPRSSTRDAAAY